MTDWVKFFEEKAKGESEAPVSGPRGRITLYDAALKSNRGIEEEQLRRSGVLQPGECRNG